MSSPDAAERLPGASVGIGDGAQAGDVSVGNVAGANIYHGANADQLRSLMAQQSEFYLTLVSAYERQYKDLTGQLLRLRDEHEMYRALEGSARTARQATVDRRERLVLGALLVLAIVDLALIWSVL